MSLRAESPTIAPGTARAGARHPAAAWARLAAVAAILAASGGARAWRGYRVERALGEGRVSPFPLASIPMGLGSWEGSPAEIDPRIVRISGSSDLIARRYVDRLTGASVVAVVCFGPAPDMIGHVPEICYPSAGYKADGPPADRAIAPAGGGPPARFRSLVYSKGEGGAAEVQEVCYSLRSGGRWDAGPPGPKASRRIAGIHKIQVCRRVAPEERRDSGGPCEPIAALLLGEIEAGIAGGRAKTPGPGS